MQFEKEEMYEQNSQSSEEEVRTTKMRVVSLMECTPGNRQNADGEPVTIITIANGDNIEAIAFNLKDTKALVIDSLISLAEFDNEFAKYLLQRYFIVGDDQKPEAGPFENGPYADDDDDDDEDDEDYDIG